MSSAEEVLRGKRRETGAQPNSFETRYRQLLEENIPQALKRLEEKGWPNGRLMMVARLKRDGHSVVETAVWKLTSLIYLSSTGNLCILVTDPLKDLPYEAAEVNVEYLVKNHSNTKTTSHLRQLIDKM